MKKLLLILFLLTTISLSACSKTNPQSDAMPIKPETNTTETPKEEIDLDKLSSPKSEDLYSYEILLNGKCYKLPISFSELSKDGWIIDEDVSTTLSPDQYTLGTILKNGSKTINSYLINGSGDILSLDKCIVGGISIYEYYSETGSTLVLPKGITLGSSKEDVISAYGEPTDIYESDIFTNLTYEANTYKSINIYIDTKTNKVSEIDLKNFEDLPEQNVNSDTSDIKTSSYKAPTELGDDLLSFNVNYDGILYTVPVPLVELKKNGWVVEDAPYETVRANDTAFGFTLRKGNISLYTALYNEYSTETNYENCLVTDLISDENNTKISMELPKSITIGSTQEEVESAFSDLDVVKEETQNYISYTYSKEILQDISIFISTETKTVYKIEINYIP